jgi:hypothetical protein
MGGYLMDESLSCGRRWLKTMKKQMIAAAEKRTELVEKINNIGSCIHGH